MRNPIYPCRIPNSRSWSSFHAVDRRGIEAGPNAVLAFAREGYRWTLRARPGRRALLFPGLWRFLLKYPGMCGYEIRRSFSKKELPGRCRTGARKSRLQTWCRRTGVRAQAMLAEGKLVEISNSLSGRNASRPERALPRRYRVAGHRQRSPKRF